jgi:hypothetical protein
MHNLIQQGIMNNINFILIMVAYIESVRKEGADLKKSSPFWDRFRLNLESV